MLKFFRNSVFAQCLVLLVLLFVMWHPRLVAPIMPDTLGGGVLYSLLCGWLASAPVVSTIIALLLIVLEGAWLSMILIDTRLVTRGSMLPMWMYALAMSFSAHSQTMTYMVFVNALLIAALRLILVRKMQPNVRFTTVFGASALLALGTMFSPFALAFLVPFLLVLVIFNLYTVRDFVMFLLGFLAPYIPFAVYAFMTDGWNELLAPFAVILQAPRLVFNASGWITYSVDAAVLLCLVLGIAVGPGARGSSLIVVEKNSAVVLVHLLGGIGMALYYAIVPFNLQFIAVGFAYAASMLFVHVRERSIVWNLLLVAVLGLLIVSPFMTA